MKVKVMGSNSGYLLKCFLLYNNCNLFVTRLEWCDGALFSMKNSGSDMHPPPLELDFSNLLGTLPPCIDDFLLRVLVFDWTAELWCLAFSGEVTGESGAVCTGRSIFLMDILLSSVNENIILSLCLYFFWKFFYFRILWKLFYSLRKLFIHRAQ